MNVDAGGSVSSPGRMGGLRMSMARRDREKTDEI